jgi:hypothetical protein
VYFTPVYFSVKKDGLLRNTHLTFRMGTMFISEKKSYNKNKFCILLPFKREGFFFGTAIYLLGRDWGYFYF